ncbi:MAG: hypothetical protein OXF39_06140 [Nitrospira sp.]|nr:hypothetical protein [Nitrospira sp.]
MLGFWLFLLLTVLKLTNVIDWSWWWVTAPLWWLPFTLLWMGLFNWLGSVFSKD